MGTTGRQIVGRDVDKIIAMCTGAPLGEESDGQKTLPRRDYSES